jgi:hypothetical protein
MIPGKGKSSPGESHLIRESGGQKKGDKDAEQCGARREQRSHGIL